MIDRIYKLIQTISNNELNGNISPQEYNLELHNTVKEVYEENLFALNNAIFRERRGAVNQFSLENLSGKFREKLMYYYTEGILSKNGKTYPLPEDLMYIDALECAGKEAEPTKNRRHFKSISNFIDTAPSNFHPIYLKIGEAIEVAPATITENLDIYYLRAPKVAKWTYIVVGTTEIFNPDALDFQDVDIHPSEEYNITIKLLQKLGVNLKDQQLVEYGIRKDQIDFQKENA